jgi:tRNA A37 N6-isopentenylltransferase MiaA
VVEMTERIKLDKDMINVDRGGNCECGYWLIEIHTESREDNKLAEQLKSQILSDYEKAELWDKCTIDINDLRKYSDALDVVERLKKRIEELEQYTFHGSYLSDGSQTKSFHSGITFEELQEILGEEK